MYVTSHFRSCIESLLVFQAGQSSTVIENIHTIIAAAAVKFSFDQLTHLFVLIQKVVSWLLMCVCVRVCGYTFMIMCVLCCWLELGG